MKYKVKIDNQEFLVEVGDIHDRPVLAVVDGETFEIWPELEIAGQTDPVDAVKPGGKPAAGPASPQSKPNHRPVPIPEQTMRSGDASQKVVRAPIPGVIVSLAVQPDSEVTPGQELCLLEAMKMKNVIRASRQGRIAKILIAPGQTVKHNDVLMEYADGL